MLLAVLVYCFISILLNGCTEDGQSAKHAESKGSAEGGTFPMPVQHDRYTQNAESQIDSFLPGMSCMVNEFGIRSKVLIAKHGVQGTATPGGSLESGEVRHFHIYFLHDVYPESARQDITSARYFQIGRSGHRENLMWIPASTATVWDHRLLFAADDEIKTRRPPLTVYSECDAVEEIIREGRTARRPIARYTWKPGVAPKFMPWPILETKYIHDADDNVVEVAKIAFLAEFREGANLNTDEPAELAQQESGDAYSDEQITSIRENISMLDVVFVIDNTSSTAPFFRAMRQTVQDIIRELNENAGTAELGLGLVLYRDYSEGRMFICQNGRRSNVLVHDLKTDIQAFGAMIAPLTAPKPHTGDMPEAVYDGLYAGLTQTSWRGNNLSTRAIILISDNSAHEPGHPKNPRGISASNLIQMANARRVHLFSLCIKGGGGEGEQRRHWQQCYALSKGTKAQCFQFNYRSVASVVSGIKDILKVETQLVERNKAIVWGLSEGKKDTEIIREVGIEAHTAVMEFLRGAGIDPKKIRRHGPSFSTGWIIPQFRGTPICQKKVYIARSEIRLLIATLQELCVYCDASFGSNVMARVLGSATDGLANIFLNDGRDAGPFDLFLIKKGIPLRTGLLRFTPDELAHMSEEERSSLRRQIERHYLPKLINAMNDDRHFRFGGVFEYGFIKAELLP